MESEGLKSSGKSNDAEASLRRGNLPKAESVRTIDPDANKGETTDEACEQNSSLMADGSRVRNVIPNSGKALMARNEDDKD
jgi:hypothetical protein